jgi:hypothetical protein
MTTKSNKSSQQHSEQHSGSNTSVASEKKSSYHHHHSSSGNKREDSFKTLFSNGYTPSTTRNNRLSTNEHNSTTTTTRGNLPIYHNTYQNNQHQTGKMTHHQQQQDEEDWPVSTTNSNSRYPSSHSNKQQTGNNKLVLVCNLRSKKQFVHNSNQVDASYNLYQFFKYTTPILHHSQLRSKQRRGSGGNVNIQQSQATATHSNQCGEACCVGEKGECYYLLKDLWNFYDEPYGFDVPVILDGRNEHTYFVPHLSAIQLYRRRSSLTTSTHPEDKQAATHEELTAEVSGDTSITSGTTESTQQSDLIFEFFETLTPDLRYPLIDKIEDLALHQCPELLRNSTLDLDMQRSWYSIAWYPILCHSNTIPWLKGQIITYHNFVLSATHLVDPTYCDNEFKEDLSKQESRSPSSPPRNGNSRSDGTDSTETFFAAPVIGFLPYKVRNETWFIDIHRKGNNSEESKSREHSFYAPLHLLRACKRILKSSGAKHNDFDHCVINCSELGAI